MEHLVVVPPADEVDSIGIDVSQKEHHHPSLHGVTVRIYVAQ